MPFFHNEILYRLPFQQPAVLLSLPASYMQGPIHMVDFGMKSMQIPHQNLLGKATHYLQWESVPLWIFQTQLLKYAVWKRGHYKCFG